MELRIERAAVLGAGVMGSALAAHLANAGIATLLLDIVPPDAASDTPGDRNAFAARGLERARKSRPAAFFTPAGARLVSIANLEDDLARLADVDWILEAVVESLDIKRALFEKIAPHVKDTAIITSNTSGLSIADMAAAMPEALRPRFLGTHFFNPPRYLHLLEIIPHAGTDPAVLQGVQAFGESALGKGVVVAKDTPNFIGNRVGVFTVLSALRAAIEGGYTVEETDALTGPLMGRPKSASCRTADLVGLDILAHAAKTVYDRATEDERREMFALPDPIQQMLGRNLLGDKTGGGFYRKVRGEKGSEILALDFETLEYRERAKARFGSVEAARAVKGIGPRLRAVMDKHGDRAGDYLWRTISETLLYTANRIGEIADDIVAVDRAMRWGFGWEMGPFELWDAIGVEPTVARMREDGATIPPVVEASLATPSKSFYRRDESHRRFYLHAKEHVAEPPVYGRLDLQAIKARGGVVRKNAGASLIDIGDGVACLEFHSKMNAIGEDIIGMTNAAVKATEANFDALVIGNEGRNFSVGANLMLILLEAQDGNWEDIDFSVRAFQKATMALKYCRRPVVAAPFGITVAGGCEIVLGAGHVMASAETYMGLVELGVGLIPAGGGCKETLLRRLSGRPNIEGLDVFPYARAAFETIGLARVSTSGAEARDLGFLRDGDAIAMNPDRLLGSAKAMAIGLAASGYRRPDPPAEIPVAGESGIAAIKAQLYNMRDGGHISEYDAYLGGELARVLCGGEVPSGTLVTEQYLLDLERQVFLRLCGQRKSQERIQYMLKKGKPLRN